VKRIGIILVGLLFLAASGALLWRVKPVRAAAAVLAGQGNGCTLARAMGATRHLERLTRTKDSILARSKLIRKDERGFELYSTPYGEFWATSGSRYTLPFNLAEQEVGIYGTGPQGVRKGDIVLDGGANVGTFARFALDAGAARVVAVEPAPDNVECLRRNFPREIAEGRLIVSAKGLWDREGVLELTVDPENQAANTFVIKLKGAHPVIQAPLTTIDKLVEELGLERVDYIKFDIEGAEVRALDGARATLAKYRPRMSLSVYHHADHPVEVPKAARRAWPGYQVECGPCAMEERKIRPDVLYFY
jgi:FkbM family methyltransferase